MFFPRKSCLLSLDLFKNVAYTSSDYELQFEFDDPALNGDNPTQGPKKLKDDDGAYADEIQQEYERDSDSEADDQVINTIENRFPREDRSLPIKINGSQNEIEDDSETNLNGNYFWRLHIEEQSKKTDLSHNKTPNTKEDRALSTH